MGKMIDAEDLIRKLEIYSRSNICSSHNGCPHRFDENTNCENCGAIGR